MQIITKISITIASITIVNILQINESYLLHLQNKKSLDNEVL